MADRKSRRIPPARQLIPLTFRRDAAYPVRIGAPTRQPLSRTLNHNHRRNVKQLLTLLVRSGAVVGAFAAIGCSSQFHSLAAGAPPAPLAAGLSEPAAATPLQRYLNDRSVARDDSSRTYRPYIAVFPFVDESGFRAGIWELERETAGIIAAALDSIVIWRIIPHDAVIEACGSGELTDVQVFTAAEKIGADIILEGTLVDYNMKRTQVGDPLLAGYKSYKGVAEMEVKARHVAGRVHLTTLHSRQTVVSRGLGIDLLGKPRERDEQFINLASMAFGSEEFFATALGEATAAAVTEMAAKLVEELQPDSIDLGDDETAEIISVHGDEVFINLGTENGLHPGYRFDVFAAAGPSDSTAIAVVAVQDVIGARLSRVRIVLASREISAGDRIAIISPH
jgi:hypothetical protein